MRFTPPSCQGYASGCMNGHHAVMRSARTGVRSGACRDRTRKGARRTQRNVFRRVTAPVRGSWNWASAGEDVADRLMAYRPVAQRCPRSRAGRGSASSMSAVPPVADDLAAAVEGRVSGYQGGLRLPGQRRGHRGRDRPPVRRGMSAVMASCARPCPGTVPAPRTGWPTHAASRARVTRAASRSARRGSPANWKALTPVTASKAASPNGSDSMSAFAQVRVRSRSRAMREQAGADVDAAGHGIAPRCGQDKGETGAAAHVEDGRSGPTRGGVEDGLEQRPVVRSRPGRPMARGSVPHRRRWTSAAAADHAGARRGLDVLVEPEDVVRVVDRLDPLQALDRAAVGGGGVVVFVVAHEVHVAAFAQVRSDGGVGRTRPGDLASSSAASRQVAGMLISQRGVAERERGRVRLDAGDRAAQRQQLHLG